jgi:hypothetical protein
VECGRSLLADGAQPSLATELTGGNGMDNQKVSNTNRINANDKYLMIYLAFKHYQGARYRQSKITELYQWLVNYIQGISILYI